MTNLNIEKKTIHLYCMIINAWLLSVLTGVVVLNYIKEHSHEYRFLLFNLELEVVSLKATIISCHYSVDLFQKHCTDHGFLWLKISAPVNDYGIKSIF